MKTRIPCALQLLLFSIQFVPWIGSESCAVIVLSEDFESGSLSAADSTVIGTNVTLQPRTWIGEWTIKGHGNQPRHWWWYFEATGVNDLKPAFSVDQAAFWNSSLENSRRFVYSYDQQQWSPFDRHFFSERSVRFSNDRAFEQDNVFVAFGLPYTVSMLANHVARIQSSPYTMPLASDTDNDFVIGRTPGTASGGYLDHASRIVPDLDIFGYRISDPTSGRGKQKVVLLGGNHAGETTGNYTLQGMIDFLLGSDARAQELRKKAEFFVYPMVDPEGRFTGHTRSNNSSPDLSASIGSFANPLPDHNRHWHQQGVFPEVDLVRDSVIIDTGGDVDWFFDFHSFPSGQGWSLFDTTSPDADSTVFLQALLSQEPNIKIVDGFRGFEEERGIADIWATRNDGLKAEYSFTPESSFWGGFGPDKFFEHGADYAIALHAALDNTEQESVLFAGDSDRDFDFDQLDLVRVQVSGKYLSGEPTTWGEGDWDGAPGGTADDPPLGDGFFDQMDIVAALQSGTYLTGPYASITPSEAGNDPSRLDVASVAVTAREVLIAVPEPTTICMLALGALCLVRVRRCGLCRRVWH